MLLELGPKTVLNLEQNSPPHSGNCHICINPSTQYVYASLITGHAQNGNMEQAEGVLELSKTKGYSPGSVAYSALLCAYAQQGDFDGMLKVG